MTDEYDLVSDIEASEWFVIKVRDSKVYAQNLYAALCNMRWQKSEVFPVLKDEFWSCSWRSAGGIVASLRNNDEDYMDWYCSGIGGGFSYDSTLPEGYVGEGFVTEEIKHDLALLGWHPSEWPEDK